MYKRQVLVLIRPEKGEKVGDRRFHRRPLLPVPVKAQEDVPPQGAADPKALDRPRPLSLIHISIGSVDVVRDILRYQNFIRRGGVTLSGGEPLLQPDFAASILEGCRENGLHTALDTSGGVSLLACRQAVDAADMLLLDMKAANDPLFRTLTGRGMDNTLDILQPVSYTHLAARRRSPTR